MKKSQLSSIVREQLAEVKADVETAAQIDEFAKLSDEIDKMNAELKKLKTRYEELDQSLVEVMENLAELGQSALQTEHHLLTIKKKGYNRERVGYKEAFELALKKVNKQTRAILDEALAATTTSHRVATSLGIQKLDEQENEYINLQNKIEILSRNMIKLRNLAQKVQ